MYGLMRLQDKIMREHPTRFMFGRGDHFLELPDGTEAVVMPADSPDVSSESSVSR